MIDVVMVKTFSDVDVTKSGMLKLALQVVLFEAL